MAVAAALFRGIAAQGVRMIGSFWVDLNAVGDLHPASVSVDWGGDIRATGVIQNLGPYANVQTVERPQVVATRSVASQESIKLLSSDGGGFFQRELAHPYENPTPLSNFLSMFLMLLIPAALTHTFGSDGRRFAPRLDRPRCICVLC